MIIQVAIGVVLGYIVIVHWRVLLSFAFLAFIGSVCIALLALIGWGIYLAYDEFAVFKAANSGFFNVLGSVFTFGFVVLINVGFGISCGDPLKERTSLDARQAVTFGLIFWVLFLLTAVMAATRSSLTEKLTELGIWLLAALLVAAWAAAIHQCASKSRSNAKAIAASNGSDDEINSNITT